MAPYLVILITAVLGFLVYGVIGLVIGAVSGWILSMLIGQISGMWHGGLLPRKVRRETARKFYMEHQSMLDSRMQGMPEPEKLHLIEKLIERICRRAAIDSPMLSKSMGMSPPEVYEAAEAEAAKELDANTREHILLMRDHILATWY